MNTAAVSSELKGYQSQLAAARADMNVANAAVTDAQAKLKAASSLAQSIEQKIANLQNACVEPIVSEHAVLRWLERVDGIDTEAVRARILDGNTASSIKFAKSGKVTKCGVTLIFKNNTVITVET